MIKDNWTLQHKDGSPVEVGDILTDFRGEKVTLMGGRPPHKPSSSGHVSVATGRELYAGVYDLVWVKTQGELI